MKNQAFFSSKDKSKKIKCCLLQFLFGALRIKTCSKVSLVNYKSVCNSSSYLVHKVIPIYMYYA